MSAHPIRSVPIWCRVFRLRPTKGGSLLAHLQTFVACRFRSLAALSHSTLPEFRSRASEPIATGCMASIANRALVGLPRAAAPSVSTARQFLVSLSAVRETDSSIPEIQVRASIASRAVNRTLSQRPQRVQVAPNHALQRTAPRVTVAAILACARLVRSWRCSTSAAPFCAPPSQLPRHAPPSLSLRSLGVATSLVSNDASFRVCPELFASPEPHGLAARRFLPSPSQPVWRSLRSTLSASPSFSPSSVSAVSTDPRF